MERFLGELIFGGCQPQMLWFVSFSMTVIIRDLGQKCWRVPSSLLDYGCRGWNLAISHISRYQTVRTNIWQTSTAIQKKSWELRFLVPVLSNVRRSSHLCPTNVWGFQFQSQGFFTTAYVGIEHHVYPTTALIFIIATTSVWHRYGIVPLELGLGDLGAGLEMMLWVSCSVHLIPVGGKILGPSV
jgi:hypothetical protein